MRKKNKVQVGGKIQEIKIQRDLFGRMLGISMDYKVDISKIFSPNYFSAIVHVPFGWNYL